MVDRVVLSAGSSLTPPTIEPGTVSNRFYTDDSILTPYAAHMLTEELRNVVVAAGITPSASSLNQLTSAINALALAQSARMPLAPIGGYTMANSGSTDYDLRISPGIILANDNLTPIRRSTTLIKQLDANWVAGTNQGGLLTGTRAANATYHIFAILNPTTGVSDIAFHTGVDPTSVLPSGYSLWARIGSLVTDGATKWIRFLQLCREFWYKDRQEDSSAANTTANPTSTRLFALPVPTGIKVKANVAVGWRGANIGGSRLVVTDPNLNNIAPTLGNSSLFGGVNGAGSDFGASVESWTDTNGQIRVRWEADATANPTGTIYVNTLGWIDPLDQ